MDKKVGITLSNIPQMTVSQAVEALSTAYSTVINNGKKVATIPAVMLWGAPGVGKSQGVRQIAKQIEKTTGKRTQVTDVRLLLFNPIDLRGIPTANAEKTLAVWLKPKIFQMDDSDDVVNILFLDELSAAPQSVQAAAYQITLDRVIGEHRLPDNCIVIAAGNRTTDKSVAYKMPKALANRLMHIEVEISFESWKEWAETNGINPIVTGFLSYKPEALMQFDASSDELAFATPRSWEMVSNLLDNMDEKNSQTYTLIAGLIGYGLMSELKKWVRLYKDLPDVSQIFKGKFPPIPKSSDELYMLVNSMALYASAHRDDMSGIANSIRFAEELPPDFSTLLLKDYIGIDKGYYEKLLKVPEFMHWAHTRGTYLNGRDSG